MAVGVKGTVLLTPPVNVQLVNITGTKVAQSGVDYNFSASIEEGNKMDELYAEIKGSLQQIKNARCLFKQLAFFYLN